MRIILLVILIFILVDCTQKSINQEYLSVPSEQIKVSTFEMQEFSCLLPDELVEERRFVLLENDQAGSEIFNLDKLIKRNGNYYVLDWAYKSILIFDDSGKFIKRFNLSGEGPGKYSRISDFDVDISGKLYVLDATLKKLFVYDGDFRFQKDFRLGFDAEKIIHLEEGGFLFALSPWNGLGYDGYRFVKTDLELKVQETRMKFDDHVDQNFVFDFGFTLSDVIVFNRPIENDIFIFSRDGNFQRIVKLDFEQFNVPDNVRRDLETFMPKLSDFRFLNKFAAKTQNNFILTVGYGLTSNRNLILDTQSNKGFIEKPLALSDDIGNLKSMFLTFSFIDNNDLVSYIHPDRVDVAKRIGLPDHVMTHLEEEGYVLCVDRLR